MHWSFIDTVFLSSKRLPLHRCGKKHTSFPSRHFSIFRQPIRTKMGLKDQVLNMFGRGYEPKDREQAIIPSGEHYVLKTPLVANFEEMGYKYAMFGLGCFWGAERKFWQTKGVYSTAVGYAGGKTKNPTYEDVCTDRTGHAEVVRVVYDPKKVSYEQLLDVFWANHDPTQLHRQGNDVGTQYRSAIFYYDEEQKKLAEETKRHFQEILAKKGYGNIVTEIVPAPVFYFAEDYHQQYLAKNPNGYCGLGGTGCYEPLRQDEQPQMSSASIQQQQQ
jgi:peptide-methionine (S)-S-oxide reductase